VPARAFPNYTRPVKVDARNAETKGRMGRSIDELSLRKRRRVFYARDETHADPPPLAFIYEWKRAGGSVRDDDVFESYVRCVRYGRIWRRARRAAENERNATRLAKIVTRSNSAVPNPKTFTKISHEVYIFVVDNNEKPKYFQTSIHITI